MATTQRHGTLARNSMAYVLAGGRGSRLLDLTDRRAKPAVYFGGKSRIIDFALSNAINSGIRRIGVATQYKAHSLIRHLQRGWNFLRPERNESFDILPASQRVSETQWYEGTADAVFQNIDIIASYNPEYMVILAGDHVYKMDYELMLEEHVATGADVTIGCLEVPRMEATGFGVMHVDEQDRVTAFLEKPKDPPGIPGRPEMALASMGIYVFKTSFLIEMLRRDAAQPGSSRDFGKDIVPYLVANGRAVVHRFTRSCIKSEAEAEAYWRDVGTVDAYWEGNLDLTSVVPALDLYDQRWPIWTHSEITPPAKFIFADEGRRGSAEDSLVSGGCIVSGSMVKRSILFTNVRVYNHCRIEDSVILPNAEIGPAAIIRNAVIDKRCRVPEGMVIGMDPEADRLRFHVTEKGRVLVVPQMLEQLATRGGALVTPGGASAPMARSPIPATASS
jgi:glucose-1-phosphate adenylyltransferase